MSLRRTISLTEYQPRRLARTELAETEAELLWRRYPAQVAVDFPSPKSDGQWQLTALGWAGYIPVSPELGLSLQPKVPLANMFRMLAYAGQIHSFRFLPELVACRSLPEFYEYLAGVLAGKVLERGRKGFYRAYLPQAERLPYVRGRLDVPALARSPEQVRPVCHYQQRTTDIEDNQILGWTLGRIMQSGLCSERTLPAIRRAYRALQGLVTPAPYTALDCAGRVYNRLNEDYRPLHALCRFFLEHTGPGHTSGDRTMLPFLVNMARIYERFVAGWLEAHLPPGLGLEPQAQVYLSHTDQLHFKIDLVVYETGHRDSPRYVLDTKYKVAGGPATEDIAQVIAYAQATGCRQAVLVYPTPLDRPLDSWVGDIRVRGLTFTLDGDLEEAGSRFFQALLL